MSSNHPIHSYTFTTSVGKYLGFNENGVFKIKSIRYAKSERFKKPEILEHAETYPLEKTPVCPQKISPLLEILIGKTDVDQFQAEESIQFLTITRPENLAETHLPVVVWIHGGSYELGCGDLPTSDPSVWVKEQNIIVVSVSYRLGLFGFLGGNDERPANLGLFDIITALKWIKKYIHDFGGNPENITLFGQSSGGDAITHLLLSDEIENLFQRVIIQSAPLGFRLKREKMYSELFKKTDFLKNEIDVLKMVDSYQSFLPSSFKYGLKAAMPFCLKYGHDPLPAENETLAKWKENASKIDVLMGFNQDETAFYVKTAQEGFYTYLHEKILDKIVKVITDSIYRNPAKIFAKNYAEGGGKIHLYKIKSTLDNHFIGASHCFDLPLIFANEKAWRNAEILKNVPWNYIFENGKKIRATWAEFARTGQILPPEKRSEIMEIKKITK